jgi:GLPGLI family protein
MSAAFLSSLTFINLNASSVNRQPVSSIIALVQNQRIMKKILFSAFALFSIAVVNAQQREGKVIYQRTIQMQFRIADDAGPEREMPRTRTDKFEMNFANGQMIIRQMEDELPEENPGGGGVMVRSFGAGADDVTFCDLEKSKKVELREFFDKKFLITDSIRRGSWKLTEETKTILGHQCRKATSQRIGKRMMMNMDNGKMERKEVDDTTTIVAWFTSDIPVSAGPEVQGQLPGLILSLETNNGRSVYTALEISPKADLAAIKEPSKGKKVTPDEFTKERNKMMDEMQKNNQGRNIQIRMN